MGNDGPVPVDLAELSSLSSLLDQITRRVTALAEGAAALRDEDSSSELYGIERALAGAARRLDRLIREQRR